MSEGRQMASAGSVAADGPEAVPVPDEFAAYVWSAGIAEVAARHGLSPASWPGGAGPELSR